MAGEHSDRLQERASSQNQVLDAIAQSFLADPWLKGIRPEDLLGDHSDVAPQDAIRLTVTEKLGLNNDHIADAWAVLQQQLPGGDTIDTSRLDPHDYLDPETTDRIVDAALHYMADPTEDIPGGDPLDDVYDRTATPHGELVTAMVKEAANGTAPTEIRPNAEKDSETAMAVEYGIQNGSLLPADLQILTGKHYREPSRHFTIVVAERRRRPSYKPQTLGRWDSVKTVDVPEQEVNQWFTEQILKAADGGAELERMLAETVATQLWNRHDAWQKELKDTIRVREQGASGNAVYVGSYPPKE